MKFSVELTKKIMRDYKIEVPDGVSFEDAKKWIEEDPEVIYDIFEVEEWEGEREWCADEAFGVAGDILVSCVSDDEITDLESVEAA